MKTLALVALFPLPLLANPIGEIICAPTAQMQVRLVQHMGSERTAMGVRGPDEIMEVWTDAQGDWTMVVRYASGTSCIVAMGAHWEGARDPA